MKRSSLTIRFNWQNDRACQCSVIIEYEDKCIVYMSDRSDILGEELRLDMAHWKSGMYRLYIKEEMRIVYETLVFY